MKRLISPVRANWEAKVEEVGLTYHTPNGQPYWDESACYQLTAQEVDILEAAANELHMRCIDAAEYVIKNDLFSFMGIPERAVPLILKSWDRDDFSLYGRFDFIYGGRPGEQPKMLEYNADTPTALVEAAVAQWFWLEETRKQSDQFNSLHEKLIAAWKKYPGSGLIHLGGLKENLEDEQTVLYVQDTCHQAGRQTQQIYIEDLGFDSANRRFVDLAERRVANYFKLYPWEWMWHEEFASALELEICQFLEPMWKMLLSNKALLPILWEIFPNHPNLLPAYGSEREFKSGEANRGWVCKPKLSREGANVTITEGGRQTESTMGEYGEEGWIYQALADVPEFAGNHPVMGVWVVNHEACGLGIREDIRRITGNYSRFVPHFF